MKRGKREPDSRMDVRVGEGSAETSFLSSSSSSSFSTSSLISQTSDLSKSKWEQFSFGSICEYDQKLSSEEEKKYGYRNSYFFASYLIRIFEEKLNQMNPKELTSESSKQYYKLLSRFFRILQAGYHNHKENYYRIEEEMVVDHKCFTSKEIVQDELEDIEYILSGRESDDDTSRLKEPDIKFISKFISNRDKSVLKLAEDFAQMFVEGIRQGGTHRLEDEKVIQGQMRDLKRCIHYLELLLDEERIKGKFSDIDEDDLLLDIYQEKESVEMNKDRLLRYLISAPLPPMNRYLYDCGLSIYSTILERSRWDLQIERDLDLEYQVLAENRVESYVDRREGCVEHMRLSKPRSVTLHIRKNSMGEEEAFNFMLEVTMLASLNGLKMVCVADWPILSGLLSGLYFLRGSHSHALSALSLNIKPFPLEHQNAFKNLIDLAIRELSGNKNLTALCLHFEHFNLSGDHIRVLAENDHITYFEMLIDKEPGVESTQSTDAIFEAIREWRSLTALNLVVKNPQAFKNAKDAEALTQLPKLRWLSIESSSDSLSEEAIKVFAQDNSHLETLLLNDSVARFGLININPWQLFAANKTLTALYLASSYWYSSEESRQDPKPSHLDPMNAIQKNKNLIHLRLFGDFMKRPIRDRQGALAQRNRIHLLQWQAIVVLTASYRANRESKIRDSIHDLLPEIQSFMPGMLFFAKEDPFKPPAPDYLLVPPIDRMDDDFKYYPRMKG